MQTMLIKAKSNLKVRKAIGVFFKGMIEPYGLLKRCHFKGIMINSVARRFKKHMATKKKFVKDFIAQWNTMVSGKINAEYSVGRISVTAKIFVAAQSWLLKNLAEHLFDSQVQNRAKGKYQFPVRKTWVSEEIDTLKKKRTATAIPEVASPKETGSSPKPTQTSLVPRISNLSAQQLPQLTEEAAEHLKACKKCKRSHEQGEKCVKTAKKKLKILRPPSANASPGKKRLTLRSPPKSTNTLESRQSLSSPIKKKTMLTLQWIASGMENMLRPKIKLKTIFMIGLVLARIKICVENRHYPERIMYRVIRRLQPKPWNQNKLLCQLKPADFEFYLTVLGSKVGRLNLRPLF